MSTSWHTDLSGFLTDHMLSLSAGQEEEEEEEEPGEDGFTLHVPNSSSVKSRISSTSSAASYDSQGTNGEGAETPTIQSEDEEGHSDNLLLTPTGMDEKKAPPFFSPWTFWLDRMRKA